MKLSQLRYFLAVCKTGNFTTASKELYVSQPAVSSAIREIESEYGVRLFERNNNQLVLTEQGKWLEDKAKYILLYVEDTENKLRNMATQGGYVRIGVAPMITSCYFLPILNELTKQFTDIKIDVAEAGSLQLRQWVENGVVDFAVCITNGINHDKVEYTQLLDTELSFFVGKSHPLAQYDNLDLTALNNQKIILLKEDSYQNKMVKQMFEANNVTLNVFMYSNQLNSMQEMLEYGNCGAFMFKDVGKKHTNLKAIELSQKIPVNLGLAWNKQQLFDENTESVKKYVVKYFKKIVQGN